MKILHLFSDWKWTGPAEPVVNLCKALEAKGHDVTFAFRTPPLPVEDSIEKRVAQAGIHHTQQFHLNHVLKPSHPSAFYDNLQDFFRLARWFRRERFDILNVHQSHDHTLGGLTARWSGESVRVIRTDHKRDFLKPTWGNRFLLSRFTDGLITFSDKAKGEAIRNFDLAPERVCRVRPAMDLSRFASGKAYRNMRSVFGIGPDETVIGMVARFQKYRRTEVFLEAFQKVVQVYPKIKLLLVGRSSQMEESVIRPMRRLGIESSVILGGYQTDHYFDALACMDLFVFLMPGSDGTARALREAMAMGKAVIVAERGILPELVERDVSGMVVPDNPEDLARATLLLLQHPDLMKKMGKAAREKAHRDFRLDQQAEEVETFYREMISLGKGNKKN